ncbi:outer membrane beta-barrel protein [Sphingobium sufflavum]|uniref:outer membrane beta-barrel protein n=1 Tax=Sphingobium sufflavum TaxID=1129547 RepID=UPI001F294F4E|nr:outer membrane beta-barrel protein [Sphingobium sufflavum]MCE7798529.1 outer membrane beta-barrel protein [Sphingobium sufflavum]
MLLVAAPAMAQGGTDGRRIDIKASVDVRHDSNAARASEANAAARGLVQADERVAPSLNFDLSVPLGPHKASLAGEVGYTFYRRNTQLNRERIAAEGEVALNLPVCDPKFSANYSRRQSDLGEIGIINATGTDSVRNTETIRGGGVTIACGKDIGLRPTVSADYKSASNTQSVRRLNNHEITTYLGGIGYVHPSVGELLVFAQKRITRFPNQTLVTGGRDGYDVTAYGARFTRNIGSRLRGTVEITKVDLSPRRAGVAQFDNINWSADVVATISSRLQLHASTSKEVTSPLAVNALYHAARHYAVDGDYALSSRLNLKLGYTRQNRDFYGVLPSLGPVLTNDTNELLFSALQFELNRRLQFTLEAGHERRDANDSFFNYRNTRFGLRTDFSF